MCFTWGKEMPITVEKAVRFFPGKIKLLRKPEKARCSQWIGSLSVVAFGSVVVQSTIAPGQFRWFFCPPFARYKRSPLNVWSNIPYKATIRYFLSGDINVFFQHVINIQLEYQSQGAFFLCFCWSFSSKVIKHESVQHFNYNPWWSNSQMKNLQQLIAYEWLTPVPWSHKLAAKESFGRWNAAWKRVSETT